MRGIAPVASVMAGMSSDNVNADREEYWRHVDDSVNAVSFGFVATAILISMFLLMAIFEKFLRSRSSSSSSNPHSTNDMNNPARLDVDQQTVFGHGHGKLGYPSPKMTIYARGVSVLMPGEEIPTYIAHPAPPPCPPERMSMPYHQHHLQCSNLPSSTSSTSQSQS